MANSFCGPFVVSYVLGVSTSQAAALIRNVTGKRSVFGVRVEDLDETLAGVIAERWQWPRPREIVESRDGKSGGVRTFRTRREPETRPTFEQFANRADVMPAGLFIVATSRHYLVLDGPRVYDNQGTGLLAEHTCKRHRIERAWRINRGA